LIYETDIIKLSTLRKIKTQLLNSSNHNNSSTNSKQQQQYNMNDPLLDTKIDYVASGLIPHYSNLLHEVSLSNKENALTIISYINAMRTEVNLSDNYRMNLIRLLSSQ
jgi:hypothetical protein